jgi:hypothetical protein
VETYKVSAWDLNTNVLLTDLKVRDAEYNVRINDAGEFKFLLPLADPDGKELTAVILGLGDNPFKVIIATEDSSKVLYSGWATKPEMSSDSEWLTVSGKALPSYFLQTVLPKGYTTAINPATLVQNIIADVQAQQGYNLGIGTRQQSSVTPPNITPAYPKTQLTTAAQVLTDITAAVTPGSGGVDYYMEDNFVGGAPVHTLVVAAPRAGRAAGASELKLDLRAPGVSWTKSADTTASGNNIFVVGAGTGTVQPTATAQASTPVGGLGQPPRIDMVLQFNHVGSKSQLQFIANGAVQMYGQAPSVMTVTIPSNHEAMPLGSFQIGDDVQVWSEPSIWFPNGFNQWLRVVAYRVALANEGISQVTLTFNRPPVF